MAANQGSNQGQWIVQGHPPPVPNNESRLEREAMKNLLASHNERLLNIEKNLLVLCRDMLLEEEYDELRVAWENYNQILEKLKTFHTLKEQD